MGILNAHAFFVCATTKFKHEWQEQFQQDPQEAVQKLVQKLVNIIKKHQKAIELVLGKKAVENIKSSVAEAIAIADPNASVIVDDIMLFDTNIVSLIAYFVGTLEILQKYRVTINLRKTRLLPPRAEFVGRDLLPNGNAPAQSKYATIEKLCAPATYSDLQMLCGLF